MPEGGSRTQPGSDLVRGRVAAGGFAWPQAFEALSVAEGVEPLVGGDLELMATAAYMIGRVPECLSALRRACEAHVRARDLRRAARASFWMSYVLGNLRDAAQASGWLARAERLLDAEPVDCAEQGLVLGGRAFHQMMAGEFAQALALAQHAARIGRSSGDADVLGLALTQVGGALVRLGRPREAMVCFDEAMVAVVCDEISPVAAGTVYCSVIAMCTELADLARARQWTDALNAWCEKQPDLVVFSGQCLVHRAELLRLRGLWSEAIEEAERACVRLAGAIDAAVTGAARYLQAEVHRLSGDLSAAEMAYRQASQWGHDPCPGLALLRIAQGHPAAGRAAIRRALGEVTDRIQRARLLPAEVELALAADELVPAQRASQELLEIASQVGTPALQAMATHAHASVLLARGEPAPALVQLRTSTALWLDLDVPYEVARSRVLIALACRQLRDEDNAALELSAAVRTFLSLGAQPDRRRAEKLVGPRPASGLTVRELEVLRLVAAGGTNQAIAAVLGLSAKTVERHLSNVYTKLGVASRAAATAYAYQHDLV
ncbi:MAG TPA: LuxR C-terminal-related transcriptional regulator [Micromonosporaceae bacterium]